MQILIPNYGQQDFFCLIFVKRVSNSNTENVSAISFNLAVDFPNLWSLKDHNGTKRQIN